MISISTAEQELVKKIAYETLLKLGIREVNLKYNLHFSIKWSNRFTRVMGQARFKKLPDGTYEASVIFSEKIWHAASPEERRVTVIHEVCHIVANFKYKPYPAAHGTVWKALMIKAGINNPQRYHTVQYKRPKDIEAKCQCSTHYISAKKAKIIKEQPLRYRCSLCHSHLVIKEN